MCADSMLRHTLLRDESQVLTSKLIRVAKALIAVEDRLADLLIQDAALAPALHLTGLTSEATDRRAVARAATGLVVRLAARPSDA